MCDDGAAKEPTAFPAVGHCFGALLLLTFRALLATALINITASQPPSSSGSSWSSPSKMNAARGSAAKPLAAAQAVNGPLTKLQEMLPPAAPATAAARAVATAEAAGAAAVLTLQRQMSEK
jgi:hypothetical protein